MASIQEVMLQLEGKKDPFIHLLEGVAGGFQSAQEGALNNARSMLLMEEKRRQMEQQAALQQEAARAEEASNQQEFSKVGGNAPAVLPKQKFKKSFELGPGGYTKKVEEVTTDKGPTLDEQIAAKVARGEMTIEQAYKLKNEGQISASLLYQMDKDKKKATEDAKGKVIPGYELTGEVVPDDVEARQLRTGVSEFTTFKEELAAYRGLIQKYGTQEMTDRAVQGQMDSYAKNLQLKVKNLAQLGVLSWSDVPFIEKQIPESSMFKTQSGMLGAIDATEKNMGTSVDNQLKVRGYRKAAGGPVAPPPAGSSGAPASGDTPKGKPMKIGRFEVTES